MSVINENMVNEEISLIKNLQDDLGETFDFKTPLDRIQENIRVMNEYWKTEGSKMELGELQTTYSELDYLKIAGYLREIKSATVSKSTVWKME